MRIRYFKNNEINYYRWDRCIKNSFNSLIYGYSWYLNTVCQNWDALIEGDYETVMPLPIVRKLGFKGIKTPNFIGSLGIFSSKLISNEKIESFFDAIPYKIGFINLNINKFNRLNRTRQKVTEKSQYELDLVKPYNKISQQYDPVLKEQLEKAKRFKLSFLKSISPNELLNLVKTQSKISLNPQIEQDNLKLLRILISTSLRYQFGELFGVYDAFNNLSTAAFFVWSENRAILLYSATTLEGFHENGFHFLIDNFIHLYSGKFVTLIFDYIGSAAIAETYKQFGAIESQYQNIIINRYPILSSMLNR